VSKHENDTARDVLDVQLAQQLVERARSEGSPVGPAGVSKTVPETALEAEMAEHLAMARADVPSS
jgi:transposase-like protein